MTRSISGYRLLVVAVVMAFSCFYSGKIYAQNPVITLKGDTGLLDTMVVEQGYPYSEPGYSANSSVYGDITKDVIVTSKVVGGIASFNNLIPGTYVFSYNVQDAAGNKATTRNRVVRITPDKTPPNLIVNGPDTTFFEVIKIPYVPLGNIYPAVKSDNDLVDGNLKASVYVDTDMVQTTVVGIYPVTYSSSDISGNKAVVVRYIDVIDTIKPVLTLNGHNPDGAQFGVPYVDPGVKITFPNDYLTGAREAHFLKVASTVNDSVAGTYQITYSLTDTFGNVAIPVVRTVVVGNAIPISIDLNGSVDVNTCEGNHTYKDAGYTLNPSHASVTVDTFGTFMTYRTSKAQLVSLYYVATDKSGNKYTSQTRNIFVEPTGSFNCPGSSITIDTTICKSSCPVFSAPASGSYYKWSTGDSTKSIQVCASNDTVIAVSVGQGSALHTFFYNVTVTKTSCVWPGDANADGIADKNDVLAIGVAYGDSGVKRPSATLTWNGQPCDDWSNSFKSGANYKNADCNGDGKVDSTDMAAIYKNYGYVHSKTNGSNGGPNDPPLSITFARDSTKAGDTVTASISLGSQSNPVSNAYGLSFSISYNFFYVKPGKATVNLSNCWLGTSGKNLIYFLRDDSANNTIDFAVTRTDHKDVSGYGPIGTVSVVMQDDLGGKTWVNRKVILKPSDVTLISADETPIPVYAMSDSTIVTGPLASISTSTSGALKDIMLYPNPASQSVNIDPGNQTLTGIRIVNEIGMVVFEQLDPARGRVQIPVSTLNSGIYTVVISSKNGTVARQILKN